MATGLYATQVWKQTAFALMMGWIGALGIFSARFATAAENEPSKFEFGGYTALEVGQIQFGHYRESPTSEIDHNWIGSAYFTISMKSRVTDHFSVLGSLETRLGYDTKPLDFALDPTTFPSAQNIYMALPAAEGIFTIGDKENTFLTIGLGRFEYKYNQEAQNLGEYLFRTGTYPAYIRTSFDLPLARVNGAIASCKLFGDRLRQDLLITTLTDIQPFTDFSLTYVADASLLDRAFSLGAGVQFANLISTMPDQTSRHNYHSNGYLNSPTDTGFYTFKGTKLLGRITLDPKRLFKAPFLGENDCKIYAEACVLGLENYPKSNAIDSTNFSNTIGYDKILEKTPIMFGFTFPTFKALDVLSFEAEWYGCRYPNAYYNATVSDFAIPDIDRVHDPYTMDIYLHDNWKWSLNARKTFFNKFSLIFQASRDHLRLHTVNMKFEDYEEALIRPNHWYWMAKVKCDF
jgi:hypothetical protein